MNSTISRRAFMASGAVTLAFWSNPVFAFSEAKAAKLIGNAVDDINSIINSGGSEASMLKRFEGIFSKYADGKRIGQLVLGPASRAASPAQRKLFASTFQTYISRKYGRRFREFIGGRIEIKNTKAVKSFYEVSATAILAGEAPFELQFVVADKNGKFIDIKIEGISLIKAERAEIGAMLDKRKGDVDLLIADLNKIG